MKIQCNSCGKTMQLADDKLPDSPRFKIKCPGCKADIVVDKAKAAETTPEALPANGTPPPVIEPEIYPPGAQVAFLYLDDQVWLRAASNFFQETGYHESTASSLTEAIQKLRLNSYHVLLLEDTQENKRLLAEIAAWPGNKRRELNLILLGHSSPSQDPMAAFNKGVNTYLNLDDREEAGTLLHNALKSYESYYQYYFLAFNELRKEEINE